MPRAGARIVLFAIAVLTFAPRAIAAPANYFQVHSFAHDTDGGTPNAIVAGADGNVYVTMADGGPQSGVPLVLHGAILKVTPAGATTVVASGHSLLPRGQMIQGSDGNLYYVGGLTSSLLRQPTTTVFPATAFTTISELGLGTSWSLVQIGQKFYGIFNDRVYSIDASTTPGTSSTVHTFVQSTDGNTSSSGGSLISVNGVLYGTTTVGGDTSGACPTSSCDGTIFTMNLDGTGFKVLHAFSQTQTTEGREPAAALVYSNERLFGTTSVGGSAGFGTAFSMALDGTNFTVLHTFAGGSADGASPDQALTPAGDGSFYGVTPKGGSSNLGTVFQMSSTGTVTVVWSFNTGSPETPLVQGRDGNFYGTTRTGGASGNGTFFKIVVRHVPADADGDGKTDLTLFRPSTATWYTLPSGSGFTAPTSTSFGLPGDVPLPGDYDGDGIADFAVYRSGSWIIQLSSTGTTVSYVLRTSFFVVGVGADLPVPGDYDGDGRTDLGIYRPSTGTWYIGAASSGYSMITTTVQWGLRNDIPVPGDYDGDGKTDLAVYRPSTGTWYILKSSSGFTTSIAFQWGLSTDIPVPGDYDGDGMLDGAVYRPSTGMWFVLKSSSNFTAAVSYQWGLPGDTPVPGDYDGDGQTDLAVVRPATGVWFILQSRTNFSTSVSLQWGAPGDIPIPNVSVAIAVVATRRTVANGMRAADFNGDGWTDFVVFRPSIGKWLIQSSRTATTGAFPNVFGVPPITFANGDTPVTADFDGDGVAELAAWRPSTGDWMWYTTATTSPPPFAGGIPFKIQWGLNGDIPVPADYDGDGIADPAVYRPSIGTWLVRKSPFSGPLQSLVFQWGLPDDVPVPGDYDGDGVTDLGVYRPSTGVWYLLMSSTNFTTSASYQWGLPGDVTVPGDYDGDGITDLAVYRPSTGVWYLRQSSAGYGTSTAIQWGIAEDTPVPGDFDGDGKIDLAVFRPSTSVWYVLQSSTNFTTSRAVQWGVPGDVPVLQRR